MTQFELAQKIKVSPGHLSRILRRERQPTLHNLCALADALDESTDTVIVLLLKGEILPFITDFPTERNVRRGRPRTKQSPVNG